jgi:two-component system, OmpR family, response regulator MprA
MLTTEQEAAGGRVLVVEDDAEIADVLRRSLRQEGYEVRTSADGVDALDVATGFVPDLVVLDLGLPRLDGIEVCKRLRADGDVPILMLTARAETEDRVGGLDSGADDYLVKPFERTELLARIRALLRRRTPNREFELLEYLMRNERLVVSRERLLDDVWGYDPTAATNTIDVFISNLRRKLEAGDESRLLHTKRGAGYVLKE